MHQAKPVTPLPIPWLAYACLAASMGLVGTYVGLSKWLVSVFPVFLLAGLRFLLAAVAMVTWVRRSADDVHLSPHDRVLLFLESFLGNFLFSICMLYGIASSTALTAGVIMAALPGVVAVMSWLFLGERVALREWAGMACAVGGIALVTLGNASLDPADANAHAGGATNIGPMGLGSLLLIGAVLCEASYVVIGKRLTGSVSPKRISALVNLWGLALVAPFALWQAQTFDFGAVPPQIWTLLLFYALSASMVTVWLWMTGLRKVPAAQAGVFTVILPISAAGVSVVFLGETIASLQILAFGLALLGVVLATWPQRG